MTDQNTTRSIYLAYDGRVGGLAPVGYLVTEPGDPAVPIAFVQGVNGVAPHEDAFGVARDIEYHPELACRIWAGELHVVDLRPYCRPDSTRPLPAWVWGMAYSKSNADGADEDEPSYLCFRDAVLLAELSRQVGRRATVVGNTSKPAVVRGRRGGAVSRR